MAAPAPKIKRHACRSAFSFGDLRKWGGGQDVRSLDDDIAPTLCAGHRVVQEPALVLDIPANLIWPYE
jgi:hypothetical protein